MSKSAKKAAAPKAAPKVSSTWQPFPKAKAAEPKKAKPLAPDGSPDSKGAPSQPLAKPAAPKGGCYVVIAGQGTLPIGGDVSGRRVKRGERDWVSHEELAWLKTSNSEFKIA